MPRPLTSASAMLTRASSSPARHRRAGPSWWASLFQRTATETTTVWQLARRLEHEAIWAEKEKCRRALARRQRLQLPIQRVAIPIARGRASYHGSSRIGVIGEAMAARP
ncbi:MAG: hypothetical protein ACRDRS_22910 [Pseudonocardiaceae bacterium]